MTNSAAGAYVGVACVAGGILVRGVLFFRCHAKRAAPQIDLHTHPSRSSAAKKIQHSHAQSNQLHRLTWEASKYVIVHVINLDLKLQSSGTLVTNF